MVRQGLASRRVTDHVSKILVLVPFPLSADQLALRERQLDAAPLPEGVVVEFKSTKAAPSNYVSHHDYVLADLSLLEAGLEAQADGFDAVCIDTVSDSGLNALRSMLDIPVVGPGHCMYAIACMLGRRFGIVTMWEQWFPLYERVLAEIGLADRCAGIRSIDVNPDNRELLAGKDHVAPLLVEAAEKLVVDDGADVICLGSRTMHEAHGYLQEHLSVPVINPGPLSYFVADAMVALGLTHSRRAYPRPHVPKPRVVTSMLEAAARAETESEPG